MRSEGQVFDLCGILLNGEVDLPPILDIYSRAKGAFVDTTPHEVIDSTSGDSVN